jgi:hypothetical protein
MGSWKNITEIFESGESDRNSSQLRAIALICEVSVLISQHFFNLRIKTLPEPDTPFVTHYFLIDTVQ